MKIYDLLEEKKPAVLKQWFDLILETYPDETGSFLKSQNTRNHNPVMQAIYESMEGILECLIKDSDAEKVDIYLDNIVKVRAVQDFSPSQAISFMFSLKTVVRGELEKEICDQQLFHELLTLESKIDSLVNTSFDIFMKCREKLYDMKANEMRNWTYRALHKTKLYKEVRTEE